MSAGLKWIFAIVGLLVGNLVAMGILIGAASADKPQVIPQYYDRAAHYNDALDQAAKNRQLGWTVTARLDGELVIEARDAGGLPIAGARVQVAGTHRGRAAGGFDSTLVETAPGRYKLGGARMRGIYDLGIVVARGTELFVDRAMVEAK